MRARFLVLCLLAVGACKKEPAATTTSTASAQAPGPTPAPAPAPKVLASRLLGTWNDSEDGTLAWEFFPAGKCKAFGNLDCQYELGDESASVLRLRYKPTDRWEDIEVTFEGADAATWKNLTETKADPEAAPTKLARAK